MALRVPKAQLPAELRESMIKQLGAVPEPVEVTYNSPSVALSSQEFSAKVATWDEADASLKTFAHMAVAAQVGCSWCLDVNYFLAMNHNLDLAKASQVPRWRESGVFTPLERDVLEYAEAMTSTPTTVTDVLSASLLERLGPAALVELTVFIGFGAELVAKVLARASRSSFWSTTVWLNCAPAGRIEVAGERSAMSLVVEDGRVARVYLFRNPLKLTRLDEAGLAR